MNALRVLVALAMALTVRASAEPILPKCDTEPSVHEQRERCEPQFTPEDEKTRAADRPEPDRLRLVQWNAHEVFSVKDADAKREQFRRFAEEIRPDIVALNEFTSKAELRRVAEHMGMGQAEIAASDFEQNDNLKHNSFEVGVISRFPISSVLEFDLFPDNVAAQGDPDEAPPMIPNVAGLTRRNSARGFLRVQIDALKLMLYVCHLKSSNGRSGNRDRDNAAKRETIAAAISRQVHADLETFPHYNFIVAGDMNVGETDAAKNGSDLSEDKVSGEGDRYDETHAIFSQGLTGGPRLESKTRSLGMETFDDSRFAGVGPIDCIYVFGPAVSQVSEATRGGETFGSDHFPVWVEWNRAAVRD